MKRIVACLVVGTLVLSGCSYKPARFETRPLIEVGGGNGHRDHDHHEDDHHDDRRYQNRHYDGRHYDGRYHDEHRRHDYDRYRDNDHRSGFCPPGQAMKGRC